MFPISDSIRARRFPFLSLFLIVLTVFVFVQQLIAPDGVGFLEMNALIPSSVNFSDWSSLLPFVTAIFLHGGILHILSNMWFFVVIVFGSCVLPFMSEQGGVAFWAHVGGFVVGVLFKRFIRPEEQVLEGVVVK